MQSFIYWSRNGFNLTTSPHSCLIVMPHFTLPYEYILSVKDTQSKMLRERNMHMLKQHTFKKSFHEGLFQHFLLLYTVFVNQKLWMTLIHICLTVSSPHFTAE